MTDERPDREAEDTGPETSAWAGLGLAWRQEPVAAPVVLDVSVVRRRARRFAWRIRTRNMAEWSASALLVVLGCTVAIQSPAWSLRIPMLAMAAVAAWVGVTLYRRGRNLPPPSPSASTVEYFAYERAQLVRQHTLLSSVRRWYLGPLFGVVALFYGIALVLRLRAQGWAGVGALGGLALSFAGQVAFFAWIDFVNRRAAKRLAARLAEVGHPFG
jgi:hypothetical protein